jgi:hypothetical protein
MTFPKDRQLASAADSDMREAKALCDMQDRDAAPGAAVPAEQTDARPFPEGWKSAAEKPPAPGWYERRYSDGIYAHWWSGEQWSATKDGNAHWRQLADAPYPLWRPVSAPTAVQPGEREPPPLVQQVKDALPTLEAMRQAVDFVTLADSMTDARNGIRMVNTYRVALREHIEKLRAAITSVTKETKK